MFCKRKNISILLFILYINCFAQNKSIFSKYYVKENRVLLRWVPLNKSIFDLGVQNGYKITRYIKESNILSSPIIIAENIKPYTYNDSVNWINLIKKNENAILIIKALYENKNSSNIPEKEKTEQGTMLYNLMLLSCDFDADIAKACGLFFKDSTILNNTVYSYKIEILNVPASAKISPATVEVNTGIHSINPEITNLTGTFKNKIINLKWKATDFISHYGAYNIERSPNNIAFEKINNSPVILVTSQYEKKKELITYTDTAPITKIKYFYRIKGINHFGEESDPSNTISGTGYEELKSTPLIDSLKVIENKKVFLHWKMSDPKENAFPKEYILMRAEKDNRKYSLIHTSSSEFSFTDETPNQSNYYKIGAVTYGNDTLLSFSKLALITDTIPPSTPTGIQAKTDSKGNVQIFWDKNFENDIQGYKIFKANSLTEEFVQINNEFEKSTFYRDKLNLKTLSKKIYYSIVATDNNYNNSELSRPVEVMRPDTIPPVPAVIKNLQIMQDGIKISWIPNSSDDVKQYTLYHQDEKTNSDTKIKTWGNSDTVTSCIDTLVGFGIGYRYKIVAMDESDNISISNIPYMFFETGFRNKITDVKSEVDRTKKTINLKWNYPEKEIEKFIIYRAKSKEALTIIKTLPFQNTSFEDNTLNIGNLYEYRIKAIFNNGAESIISNAIMVEY